MKKLLFAFIALLWATTTLASLNDTRDLIIIDTAEIPFGNGTIKVMVLFNHSNATATIGTGYTACIPQDTEGKIHIPSTVKEEDTGIRYHVTAIAPMAFRFCTKLTDVEIDEGVTSIGNYAFIGCYNLETVSLPSTVTQIGDGAFCELPNLVAMKCARSSPPTWHWYDVFQKDGSNNGRNPELKLYVPSNGVTSYNFSKDDYSWTCMNTSTTPYSWTQTETRSQVGWGSYFEDIRSLEQWDQDHCISIYTVDDLRAFRDKVNSGTTYRNYVVKLEADLDLSCDIDWTPIGRVTKQNDRYYDFYGTFDGQGHTISNLSIGDNDSYTSNSGHNKGLFGGTRNATVKNLIMENATVKGNYFVGVVIAHAQAATTVENVWVKNSNVTGRCFAGGIIGGAEDYNSGDCELRMNGCVVEGGSVTSVWNECYDEEYTSQFFCLYHPSRGAAGGLIGYTDEAWFTNCANLQTKVTWSSIKVTDASLIVSIDRQVCRGALVGYQDEDVPTGQKSMAYCYAHLHSENSLTREDYFNNNNEILDPYRLYGNVRYWNAVTRWSRDTDKVAAESEVSNLKGMQLETTLTNNNPGQWAFKYNALPVPGYFAYKTYGDLNANEVVYMPYGVFVDKPNYLTVDINTSSHFYDYYNTFTAHSIYIDNNFEYLDGLNARYLPIGYRQITSNNGFVNPITLSATSNGTQQVTTEHPVYVKDDENMPVLDPHGNPVQATNQDGSPKTESVTETVSLYTPQGYAVYLPYSTYLNSNCEVYEPTTWDVNTGRLNFTRVENNQIQAYKPYYVLVKEGEVDLNTVAESVIEKEDSNTSNMSDNSFYLKGTLRTEDNMQGSYVLDNNQWRKVDDNSTTLHPFSFYITPKYANPGVDTFGMNLIDNSIIHLAVTGHGDNDGGWRFIASPVAADIPPAAVENLEGVKYETGIYNYDLYRYNPSADLQWENYHGHDTDQDPFMLVNGKGYLYATKADRTLVFDGPFNTENTKDVTLQEGFNLIGNPFTTAAYVNRSYYKMNAEGTDIEAVDTYTTTTIPVCTGVVVKAENDNETVRFSKEAPAANANNNGSLQMTLVRTGVRNDAVQDKAIVSFNEGAELGKFIFNEDHAKLYIPQNGRDYSIAFSEMNGEIPLNFKTKVTGRYTIGFNFEDAKGVKIQLIDKIEDRIIDLNKDVSGNVSAYTFMGSSTDHSDRFTLVFTQVEVGGIFAYQSGNDIIVSGEGELQVFDVMGRMVMTQYINGVETCHDASLQTGVYIFRLNGKTQRIVVR